MLRFEPGDVMRALFAADFAEADKGVHLVFIAMHSLGHRGNLRDIRIGRGIEQMRMPAQPPQQPIQHRKPLGIAMQDGRLREFDEFRGDIEGGLERAQWGFGRQRFGCGCELLRLVAPHDPWHAGWLDLTQHQRSRRCAPAFEIGFAVERDEMH